MHGDRPYRHDADAARHGERRGRSDGGSDDGRAVDLSRAGDRATVGLTDVRDHDPHACPDIPKTVSLERSDASGGRLAAANARPAVAAERHDRHREGNGHVRDVAG
jgi:hypothetical protein